MGVPIDTNNAGNTSGVDGNELAPMRHTLSKVHSVHDHEENNTKGNPCKSLLHDNEDDAKGHPCKLPLLPLQLQNNKEKTSIEEVHNDDAQKGCMTG